MVEALAVYAIAEMLTSYDGPAGIIARLRNRLKALQCFFCASVWVGLTLALFTSHSVLEWVINGFFYVAVAYLINMLLIKLL